MNLLLVALGVALIGRGFCWHVAEDGGISLYVHYADDLESATADCRVWTDQLTELLTSVSRALYVKSDGIAYLKRVAVVLPFWVDYCPEAQGYSDSIGQQFYKDIKIVKNLRPDMTFMENSKCRTWRYTTLYLSWAKVSAPDEEFVSNVADRCIQQLLRKSDMIEEDKCKGDDFNVFREKLVVGNPLGHRRSEQFRAPEMVFHRWDDKDKHSPLRTHLLTTDLSIAEDDEGLVATARINYRNNSVVRPVLDARVAGRLSCDDVDIQVDLFSKGDGVYQTEAIRSLVPGGAHTLRIFLDSATLPHVNWAMRPFQYSCCSTTNLWGDARQTRALAFDGLVDAGRGSSLDFHFPSELDLVSTTTTTTTEAPTTTTTTEVPTTTTRTEAPSTTKTREAATEPSSVEPTTRSRTTTQRSRWTSSATTAKTRAPVVSDEEYYDDEYYDQESSGSTAKQSLALTWLLILMVMLSC